LFTNPCRCSFTKLSITSGSNIHIFLLAILNYKFSGCIEMVLIDFSFLYCVVQERGENVPPEDSFEVARKVKETHCYTCSDIVKVIFASIRISS
jgi:actin-related protein 3